MSKFVAVLCRNGKVLALAKTYNRVCTIMAFYGFKRSEFLIYEV